MDDKILLLASPLREVLWGDTYFRDVLKLTKEDKPYGEYWTLSGYKSYPSIIKNGVHKGKSLDILYKTNPELFAGSISEKFPILIKVIATKEDLSVQVHPDDEYARRENDFGKTESWLILKAEPNSKIVYGHNAKTKEDFIKKLKCNDFDHLLDYQSVSKGMFVKVNAGTLHALGKGLVLIEVQQSSNVTYRFYDYNRVDKDGKQRELHLDKAIDVTNIPNKLKLDQHNYLEDKSDKILWDNAFFKVELRNIDECFQINNVERKYYLVTVAAGNFEYGDYSINLGDSFIITSKCDCEKIKGNGKLLIVTSHQ